ncbi:MAG: hypothetical protein B7Y39_19185 [Bdellovibrio sp. 28-41-41]|nr:MAG: hypothetical protein B7Y39_19185 [Bdellovibrio sp. 28-41-41]
MFNNKSISSKLTLVSTVAIMTVSLLNVQTAYGYVVPGGDSNKVTAVVPRPGNPQPIRPTPEPRPIPRPSPTPVPSPRPQPDPRPYPRPTPRPYPVPYPTPGYPYPYPYPGYPPPVNYTQYKTSYINRWVYSENFYVDSLLGYGYSGYRLKTIRVDVSGDSAATVSLLINGQLIDMKYTSGSDVYLYPNSYGYYDTSSLRISVNGAAYIYNIVFELERRY